MEITKTTDGSTLTLALAGRLDTITAPNLEAEIKASVDASVTELVLDLAALEYISSAGLRVLLSGHKLMQKQGSMVVKNVAPAVMEVFSITGFNSMLTIE